jgi:hypothetical protein
MGRDTIFNSGKSTVTLFDVHLCVCVCERERERERERESVLNMFIHNMLHYRVILHVQVYTLLYNDCLLFDNNGHLSRAQNNLRAKYT